MMFTYTEAGIRGGWIQLFLCICLSLSPGVESKSRALEIMDQYPLIDGHNDLALRLRMIYNNRLSQLNLYKTPQVGLMKSRKIACLISVEGGHSIDSSLPTLRMFYQLGVRSMALTHTCNTPWAESSSSFYSHYQRNNNSLTRFGKAVVHEMNRLGMLVDLSHSSWETARAVLRHSRAPVIFSHSSVFTVCNNVRNVPDDLLHQLRNNSGLIMVNFYNSFITCSENATVSNVADHFDHLKRAIGTESIGIGADFEGAQNFPEGLKDVSKYPALIEELIARNWTEQELAGVLRLNFLRVFQKVEEIRDEMLDTLPSEEEIPFEEANNDCRAMLIRPAKTVRSVGNGNASVGAFTCYILLINLLF
ncbi:hypothetical protein DNTS_015668 [Danionella cerebrum]|uniref:Dipeptidase n=1 Tax=Danionella cerebrum TaxID=2873325 RepID=A0A553MTL4_9TELE|nr:hypothetical protein DNTS_015667 [Danionella translucida]TRY56519.1 hypothetical protein DNTS_015668 [Danionella translucida]